MSAYQAELQQLKTLRDLLRWTTSRFIEAGLFFGQGNQDAFNEASQLILHSLHLPVDELPELFIDARLTVAEKNKIADLIDRRINAREPLAYLIREAWFAGMPFYVDQRVLIPRSPFAELIADHFRPWLSNPESVNRILDMCTGSGCIGIACAQAFADAQVDIADISDDALQVARINVDKFDLDQQVTLIQSDLWANLHATNQYDLIVSNPPYVGAEEMATLPAEYRHEPVAALEAADNGLALVEGILLQAADYLSEQGILLVEVGNSDDAVQQKWPETPFLWLDFARGGHGVFMLTRPQCVEFSARYAAP